MVHYGLKVAGTASIKNGTVTKKEKLKLKDLKLHDIKNPKGKTLSENIEEMIKAWDDIAQYGFHAVGMSVLIVVQKDKKGNAVGFHCKFIDFAHVEVCALIPSVDKLKKSDMYKNRLKELQHLEIGYLLHKKYKINSWYPILNHFCKVLKDCPYGKLDKLNEIILNFFMIDGILKIKNPEDRRDDFGDGWVVDEGVNDGLQNLLRISKDEGLQESLKDRPEGPTRQIIRDVIKNGGKSKNVGGFQSQLQIRAVNSNMVKLKF
jgi:hypothetical protein